MRLAVFTTAFPGRAVTFFARDMAGLRRAGVDVDVFPIYPLEAEHWAEVPDCLGPHVLSRDRVHHVGPMTALGSVARASWSMRVRCLADTARVRASALRFGPAAIAKTEYAILKACHWAATSAVPYDHVLAYWGNYPATAAYVFHRVLGRAVPFSVILHAHDVYARQIFLREKLLHADNILVVCEFNRRFLATRFPDLYSRIANRIHLHHLGLDVAAATPVFEGRKPHTCLAVGRLDPSKGFDDLLRAAARLRDRGRAIEVEIVGDGAQAAGLKRLSAALRLEGRVHFRGWLRHDAVPDAMTQATMLVHPSCGLGDAVPTVIKEAMALGTPVVGSTAVGIPELLDHGRCGLLVPERDVDRLADAIERLLVDADLRDGLARAARTFAEQTFDLWRNGERLAALLRATRRTPPAVMPLTRPRSLPETP